jgi:hypothetical protein
MKISELINKLQQWPNQDAEVYAFDIEEGWYELNGHLCEMVSIEHNYYNGQIWTSILESNWTPHYNEKATPINAIGIR